MTRFTTDSGDAYPTWDDMRFPATAINPPGQASDPDYDTTHGTLLFGATGEEVVFLVCQLPHNWLEGSVLKPHVHWAKTTSASGNVFWRLEYKWWANNAVRDAAYTALDVSTTVNGTPDTDEAEKLLISSFGEIDGTGYEISDMLVFRLSRQGGEAADTYGADAELAEFDIHYQHWGEGTTLEFEAAGY